MNDPAEIDAVVSEQARRWVQLLASGETAADDLQTIRLWLEAEPMNARAFERERAFWQDMEPHRALFTRPLPAPAPHRRALRRVAAWRPQMGKRAVAATAVACLALALVAPDIMLRLRADHLAQTGTVQRVSLADGSTAMLDSGAAISVDYGDEARLVTVLRGRAWFDVAHSDKRPFRVAAGKGVTEDIGTAFEVAHEGEGAVQVAVSQGAVRVMSADDTHSLQLNTGNRARYTDGAAQTIASTRPDRVAAWRHGELLIDELPLAQAIDAVRAYRSGPVIVLTNLDTAKPVSAVFRTDRPDDALAALAAGAGLRLTHLPAGAIVIRR